MLLNEQDFSKLTVKKAKPHSTDIALRIVNSPVFSELQLSSKVVSRL